jgi:guanylate kinase
METVETKQNTMSIKIIIVGPAASGKSTLAERMRRNGLLIGQLATTRPKRNEHDTEYWFTDANDIESCQFRVKFNNWWYGLSTLEYLTSDVFIVGPEMLRQIRIQEPTMPLIVIYLNIPEHIRYERLMKRDMPGDSVVGRIGRDRADFANFTDYTIMVTDPNF